MSDIDITEDPKWADVVPFPQDDGGPNPLAAIAYTEGYATAMSYLRAIMAANELSERALELTEDIIAMNPAHYTVWLYRAKILSHLSSDLREEILWLNHVALAHQKNYQIWHHRQFLLDRIDDPTGEIAFVNRMLKGDAKNYHVWSYRQWLVRRFGLWGSVQYNGRDEVEEDEEGAGAGEVATEVEVRGRGQGTVEGRVHTTELEETVVLISEDVRNNSAWNHRFFIVNGNEDGLGVRGQQVYEREVRVAEEAIRKAPQNQSPWNYLRGTVERAKGKEGLKELKGFCEEFVELGKEGGEEGVVRSSHALDVLAEIYAMEQKTAEAKRAYELLATRFDPIRGNYWNYLKGKLGGEAAAGVA